MQTQGRASFDNKQQKPCGEFRVLVGVTGSVAALKLPLLVEQLRLLPGVDVRVVTTEHAKHFYNPEEVSVELYDDKDEWEMWKQRSDPVLHIELRRWADLFVIAPLDANTLGKMANGICDNLLTCVVRAWDITRPLLFCPAMNTAMWHHPITAQQISRLKEFGYTEIPCIAKKLVCGDEVNHCWLQTNPLKHVDTFFSRSWASSSCRHPSFCSSFALDPGCSPTQQAWNSRPPTAGICALSHLSEFSNKGKGGMAEVPTIVSAVSQFLQMPNEPTQKT
ncbi:phosphopantothenoylcysteine decarboxylase isoform X2 [Betta splendens]|uniref:Phosphopantothenoylcysteine decarboxylase n=1 Tax=Betta splendens TaxID=158456 RepID=A0A6P7MND9_BETSP|nr:phosphopantothenoylcysteine decarboxylase isoform X2 [Betta splendens]